jgi:hypothetical protein
MLKASTTTGADSPSYLTASSRRSPPDTGSWVLVTRDVVDVSVPCAATREPAPHGCPPAILARWRAGIGLQVRDQPSPLLLGKTANLLEDFAELTPRTKGDGPSEGP